MFKNYIKAYKMLRAGRKVFNSGDIELKMKTVDKYNPITAAFYAIRARKYVKGWHEEINSYPARPPVRTNRDRVKDA